MTPMPEFRVSEAYTPTGDQPQAIEALSASIRAGDQFQTLLGATCTGKTAAMAWIAAASLSGAAPDCACSDSAACRRSSKSPSTASDFRDHGIALSN